jgi:hypothetical protein
MRVERRREGDETLLHAMLINTAMSSRRTKITEDSKSSARWALRKCIDAQKIGMQEIL